MFNKHFVISLFFVFAPLASHAQHNQDVFGSLQETPRGLTGKVYFIGQETRSLPDFKLLKPVGTIYSEQLAVTPRRFDNGFPGISNRFEWFAIDYQGQFFVGESASYAFRLNSDDGSRLIIDGDIVINNDGIHAPVTRDGSIYLEKGFHNIRVQYFQGPRYQVALVLEVAVPGGEFELFNTAQRIGLASGAIEHEAVVEENPIIIAALLSEVGYYNGQLENIDLDELKEGLKSFQKDVGLNPTGKLDQQTYSRLLSVELSDWRKKLVDKLLNP
jgi:hypothetical protein